MRDRLEWENHGTALEQQGKGSFRRMYHMDLESFLQLLSMVGPYLCVDEKMLKVSTMKVNIVTAEITLHCLL